MPTRYTNDATRNASSRTTHDPTAEQGVAAVGRSKHYSIDGIPIPFTDEGYDNSAARREQRRQILHEDQIVIDVIVQAVTSRIIK